MISLDPAERCSLRSREADESLSGTASTIRRWLLIEHDGPWGRDGLRDARLPEGLGDRLHTLERRFRGRVLLIRRPERTAGGGSGATRCFAVDTREAWVGTATLDRIEDAAVLDPRDGATFADVHDPLFVVCTHGRRDPCCAERGRPLAQALAAAAPGAAWESTHVGGDRFAGNLVAVPDGTYYGRVEAPEAWAVVEAVLERRVHLPLYRGRSCYGFAAQAGELAVRQQTGLLGLDDVLVRSVVGGAEGWVAEVAAAARVYEVAIRVEEGAPTHLTCSTTRLSRPKRYVGEILRARAA